MKIIFFLILLFPVCMAFSQEQIRIMAYNVFEYDEANTSHTTDAKKNALISVIDNLNPDPDIIVGVEIKDDQTQADNFRVHILNGATTDKYLLGPSPIPTGAAGNSHGQFSNFLYYKPEKFTYLSGSIVADNGKWPTLLFQLYNNLTGNKIIIYGAHFTSGSSNQQQRNAEATAIRNLTSALVNYITAGDLNLVASSNESAYSILTNQNTTGYFIDTGDFIQGDKTFRSYSINSRYDLILNSPSIQFGTGGISYNQNSFTVDGNDGSSSNAGLPYTTASDHLPVYADYTFDYPSPVNPPYPGSIVFTQVGATDPDVIEFMTLYRMDLTTLKITDNSVNADSSLGTGEGTFDLSNLDGIGSWNDVPAGTFVRLDPNLTEDDDASDRFLVYDGTGSGTLPSLTTGGEQLIAYTGTSSNPTYIAGINWGNSGWLGATSYAPGTPSDISLGTADDYYFSGSVNDILYITRNTLTNASNWSVPSPTGYKDLRSNIGNSALPVELSFFTAKLNGNQVELNWRTETEVKNYGFEIERNVPLTPPEEAKDVEWITIGFVEGFGNSNSSKEYNFIDDDINQSAKYYYRLKQIDNDGTYEYSDVVTVEVGIPAKFYLSQNYPNPFNPVTRIDYTVPERQEVSLRVYNMLGELVSELVNETKEPGSYSVTFDASNLPSGTYFYRISAGKYSAAKKMSLLK